MCAVAILPSSLSMMGNSQAVAMLSSFLNMMVNSQKSSPPTLDTSYCGVPPRSTRRVHNSTIVLKPANNNAMTICGN